jgi:hypothetical protein
MAIQPPLSQVSSKQLNKSLVLSRLKVSDNNTFDLKTSDIVDYLIKSNKE